jgi:hypothetical protein
LNPPGPPKPGDADADEVTSVAPAREAAAAMAIMMAFIVLLRFSMLDRPLWSAALHKRP